MEKLKLGLLNIGNEFITHGDKIDLEFLNKDKYKKYLIANAKITEKGYEGNYDVYNIFIVCAIVNSTKDFNPFSENTIYVDYYTHSYQIRPKIIYRDKKGLYYKPYDNIVRLTDEETKMVEEFINKNNGD